jgi:copper chaperone CopZ
MLWGALASLGGVHVMPDHVHGDQFVLIKIEGMHCHRCQRAIAKALQANRGVHEVEVDFLSGQASVLYDPGAVSVRALMDTVAQAGYRATGFSQGRGHPKS